MTIDPAECWFRVVRHPTRRGYTIQAPPRITWADGPGNTFGFYRRRREAQAEADAYNREERKAVFRVVGFGSGDDDEPP